MCIKLDKYKNAILTAAGFMYSGQKGRKDKRATSCWIIVNSLSKHKMAATEIRMSNETQFSKVANEGLVLICSLFPSSPFINYIVNQVRPPWLLHYLSWSVSHKSDINISTTNGLTAMEVCTDFHVSQWINPNNFELNISSSTTRK